MITRNLYPSDAVVATLLYAIHTNNYTLAIQTANELEQSGETGLLFNAISLAWWLTDPCNPRECEQYEHFVNGNIHEFLLSLFVDRPSELPLPIKTIPLAPPSFASTRPIPTQWKSWPKDWTPQQAGRLWSAVNFALKQKHHEHATYLVRPLLLNSRISIAALLIALGVDRTFVDTLTITVYLSLAERMLAHAFASIVAEPSAPHSKKIEWNNTSGRCFSVLPEAMSLWRVQPTPVTCLIGAPLLVTYPSASKFWRDQVHKHGCKVDKNSLVFPTDELCESFYNNFPIDIPDEWSIAEREKSHGLVVPQSHQPNSWIVSFIQLWA